MLWKSKKNNINAPVVNDNNANNMMIKEPEFPMRSSATLPTIGSLASSWSSSSLASDFCSHADDESKTVTQPLHLSESADCIDFIDNDSGILFDYEILPDVIGSGTFGVVRKCVDRETGEYFAVKSIHKSNIHDFGLFQREVELLQQVDNHRNVIGLVDVYEDFTHFHLVTEICQGGELFDQIRLQQLEQKEPTSSTLFSEARAAGIIRSILDAVAYLHDKDIVHRDLKPENCLLQQNEIKIIDFGLATTHDSHYDAPLTDIVGTPYYMAPEVLKQKYTKACDIWSVGVITYILLCGHPPFDGQGDEEVFAKIRRGHFSLDNENVMSKEAKDFIKCLLRRDPRKRWSAEQALQHPWMKKQLRRKLFGCRVN